MLSYQNREIYSDYGLGKTHLLHAWGYSPNLPTRILILCMFL